MRFVNTDGSFNHAAIDVAFRRRLRHYTLFDENVPGVVTVHAWKNAVMDSLEAEILAEKRKWQHQRQIVDALKGIAG